MAYKDSNWTRGELGHEIPGETDQLKGGINCLVDLVERNVYSASTVIQKLEEKLEQELEEEKLNKAKDSHKTLSEQEVEQ